MEVLLNKNADHFALTAKISDDRLKLFIDVVPAAGGHRITRADLISLLVPPLAAEDLDNRILDDIASTVSAGNSALERRIKKGVPSEPGVDGKLLVLVKKFTGQGEIKVDDHGYGSLSERHLFDNIAVGQIVARVYPPKDGKAGIDVLGSPIAINSGKPVKIEFDKTILLEQRASDDFEVLVAQQEGFLVEDNRRFSIRDELAISGDLDLKLGSIDCIGKVKVSGHVAPGLTVRAKKGITIGEGLQESVLECSEGDVIVRGFGFGGMHGKIVCGGEVQIRVAQELRIEALRDIKIEKESVDCTLRTQSQIQMSSANLVGGEAYVVCGLEAKNIGNEVGKRTIIHLCSDIETSTEFTTLQATLASHDQAIRMLEAHLGPYAKNSARVQLLKQPFRERMEKMLLKRDQIARSRNDIAKTQKAMLNAAHRSDTLRVNARSMFYPGVCIIAGDQRFEVKDPIVGPKTIEFSPKEKSFTVRSIEPVVCNVSFEIEEDDGKPKSKS